MKIEKIITIILICVALITAGVVLYNETTFFQDFVKGFLWFYNGLRHFHWE